MKLPVAVYCVFLINYFFICLKKLKIKQKFKKAFFPRKLINGHDPDIYYVLIKSAFKSSFN